MSYFLEPSTGNKIDIFGNGGGQKTAKEMGIRFLGEIPLESAIRVGGDTGSPIALRTKTFHDLAINVDDLVSKLGAETGPTISLTD
jgi:ATP-binding protein involved in chromosome partitioning